MLWETIKAHHIWRACCPAECDCASNPDPAPPAPQTIPSQPAPADKDPTTWAMGTTCAEETWPLDVIPFSLKWRAEKDLPGRMKSPHTPGSCSGARSCGPTDTNLLPERIILSWQEKGPHSPRPVLYFYGSSWFTLLKMLNHNFTAERLDYPWWARSTHVLFHPWSSTAWGLMPRPENVLSVHSAVTQEEFSAFLLLRI